MEKYQDMKKRHQDEFNAFPKFAAFNQNQFDDGMRSLGLEPSDKHLISSIGAGVFVRKADVPALKELFTRQKTEVWQSIEADTTGEGFIFSMFDYELANHEYSYTRDLTDTFAALNLSVEEVNERPAMLHGLQMAIDAQTEGDA